MSVRHSEFLSLGWVSGNRPVADLDRNVFFRDPTFRILIQVVNIDEWLEKDGERQLHLVKDCLVLHRDSRSQDRLNWGIKVVLARNYTDNLAEEVKKGQAEKFAQGHFAGHSCYGYAKIGDKGHRTDVPNSGQATYIARMFELYDSGRSLKEIEGDMFDEGLRMPNGKRLPFTKIHHCLTDDYYTGKVTWKGETKQGMHELLVRAELYARLQARLRRNDNPKNCQCERLFRGLFKCD